MLSSSDSTGSRALLSNTAYGLLDSAIAQAANLGVSVLLGRLLGPVGQARPSGRNELDRVRLHTCWFTADHPSEPRL